MKTENGDLSLPTPKVHRLEPVRRTKREQRIESLEKLCAAARTLFVSRGYRATTLEQITAAAALTKGALYFYFGSKEAMLLRLLDGVEADVITPIVETLCDSEGSAREKLVQFVHQHAVLGLTNREDLLLLISMSIEFAEQTGEASARIKAIYNRLYKALESLIARGLKAGEIRAVAPVRELAAIIIANHDGIFLEWYRRGTQLNGKHLVRATRSIMLGGIGLLDASTNKTDTVSRAPRGAAKPARTRVR
jgi:AcrR family transcriptional regulator